MQIFRTRLKHLLNIVDFRSVEERADVIATLQTDAMTLALQEIHRRDAVSFVRKSDFQSALRAAQLTDEEFRLRIANEFVLNFLNKISGFFYLKQLIGSSLAAHWRFGRYVQFLLLADMSSLFDTNVVE
jgi:hypothetical protein